MATFADDAHPPFSMEPTSAGPVTTAVFDDTCGNLIMLTQLG